MRGAGRPCSGPTTAFLRPRLRTPSRNLRTGLRACRPLASVGELTDHNLVDKGSVHWHAKHAVPHLYVAQNFASNVPKLKFHSLFFLFQPVLLINSSELWAPGTAPLSNRRFRSRSIETTSMLRTVTRALPIWPAIFKPLSTLPGEEPAPIDPGAR